MSEVNVGDVIVDNDPRTAAPRMVVRELVTKERVVSLGGKLVRVQALFAKASTDSMPNRFTTIRLDRIHTDGKPRRSGWRLVLSGACGKAKR